MLSHIQCKQILHRYGLKVTSARLLVLDILIRSDVALSHNDILSQSLNPQLDKVTLYRTLDAFVKSGLAHKVATEDRNWLYALHHNDQKESFEDDHAHFICDECERIYCVPVVPAGKLRISRSGQAFTVRSHEYRLHGTCPQCQ